MLACCVASLLLLLVLVVDAAACPLIQLVLLTVGSHAGGMQLAGCYMAVAVLLLPFDCLALHGRIAEDAIQLVWAGGCDAAVARVACCGVCSEAHHTLGALRTACIHV